VLVDEINFLDNLGTMVEAAFGAQVLTMVIVLDVSPPPHTFRRRVRLTPPIGSNAWQCSTTGKMYKQQDGIGRNLEPEASIAIPTISLFCA
jgi:hypothetical protein